MEMPRGYDAWRLSGPEEHIEIGTEDGQPCLRVHEPDEDAPRGYKPTPCQGLMVADIDDCFDVRCDTCGELA